MVSAAGLENRLHAQMSRSGVQSGSVVINTQAGLGSETAVPSPYHSGQVLAVRGGLAQLQNAYGSQSPLEVSSAVVGAVASNGRQVATQMAAVRPAMAAVRPAMSTGTVMKAPDEDSPPGSPVNAAQPQSRQSGSNRVRLFIRQSDGSEGREVDNCVQLDPGTNVLVKENSGTMVPAVWNGQSVTLEKSFTVPGWFAMPNAVFERFCQIARCPKESYTSWNRCTKREVPSFLSIFFFLS